MARDDSPTDCILVLGSGLNGSIPSYSLVKRLECAVQLLQKHPETPVILSGGRGPGENITEAQAMRKFLLEKGISSNRIFLEERSTDTAENILFSKKILEQIFPDKRTIRVTLVTNHFHMLRANLTASRYKFHCTSYAASYRPGPTLVLYALRELPATLKLYLTHKEKEPFES